MELAIASGIFAGLNFLLGLYIGLRVGRSPSRKIDSEAA